MKKWHIDTDDCYSTRNRDPEKSSTKAFIILTSNDRHQKMGRHNSPQPTGDEAVCSEAEMTCIILWFKDGVPEQKEED